METKTCNRCWQDRPVTEFYRNCRMPDGRLNQCRACHRVAKRERYEALRQDPERLRAERARARRKEMRHRAKYRRKRQARDAVKRALKRGDLIRPGACSRCGAGGVPEAHHPDYDRQLEVEWLCRDCHTEEHMAEAIS